MLVSGFVLALASIWSSIVLADDNERSHGSVPLRTHSLTTPFLDSNLQSRFFDYGGDTIVRADKYVRLVSDQPSQSGWIFSRIPLSATNWEIEVEFSVHGKRNLFGDGMGIFVTKERATQGPVFGFQDKFEGLAILVDTYRNNRPGTVFPYIMGMIGDGKTAYDKDNDGKSNEIGGCSARGMRNSEIPTKVKITYFAEQSLRVDIMYKKDDEWSKCFEVFDAKLPDAAYLGLTAETGELTDNFDILRLETRNLYHTDGGTTKSSTSTKEKNKGKNTPESKSKQKSSSSQSSRQSNGRNWTWTFLKVLLFFLVVVGGYVGFTMYRAQRRDRF